MNDFRETATYQALVNCLVRYLWKTRGEIIDPINACGPITEETRENSDKLDQADYALTELGLFDTPPEK